MIVIWPPTSSTRLIETSTRMDTTAQRGRSIRRATVIRATMPATDELIALTSPGTDKPVRACSICGEANSRTITLIIAPMTTASTSAASASISCRPRLRISSEMLTAIGRPMKPSPATRLVAVMMMPGIRVVA